MHQFLSSVWCSEMVPGLRSPAQTRTVHIQLHQQRILHSSIILRHILKQTKPAGLTLGPGSPCSPCGPLLPGLPCQRDTELLLGISSFSLQSNQLLRGQKLVHFAVHRVKDVSCPRELVVNGDRKKINQVIQQMWKREERRGEHSPSRQVLGTLLSPPAGTEEGSTSSLWHPQQICAEITSGKEVACGHENALKKEKKKRRGSCLQPFGTTLVFIISSRENRYMLRLGTMTSSGDTWLSSAAVDREKKPIFWHEPVSCELLTS